MGEVHTAVWHQKVVGKMILVAQTLALCPHLLQLLNCSLISNYVQASGRVGELNSESSLDVCHRNTGLSNIKRQRRLNTAVSRQSN